MNWSLSHLRGVQINRIKGTDPTQLNLYLNSETTTHCQTHSAHFERVSQVEPHK